MVFGDSEADIKPGEDNLWLLIPPIVFLGIIIYLSFTLPPFLKTLITEAVNIY